MTYHHGNLREALLDAATDLLVKEGPSKLSLRAAARQAGVSQSAPYRHFSAKEELLAAVGQRGFKQLKDQMVEDMTGLTDHVERLHSGGSTYVNFAIENPHLFRLMFGPLMGSDNEFENLHLHCQECFAVLMEVVSEGQAAGVFKPGNGELLAYTAWTMVHGIAHLAIDGQLQVEKFGDLTTMKQLLSQTLFTGLKA